MEEDDFDTVQVTFSFTSPKSSDSNLLYSVMPRYIPINQLELARFVAGQSIVGTILKDQIDGEPGDSFFGYCTCVNLGVLLKEVASAKDFVDFLKGLNDPALNDILVNNIDFTGWILSERAQGVPDDVTPHLMRGLFNEILWATEDAPTDEMKKSFMFRYYLVVRKAPIIDGEPLFHNFEDQFFMKKAMASVVFDSPDGVNIDDENEVEYKNYVFVLDASDIPGIRDEINVVFGINESDYEHEHHV